jgi:hypothetical protein
MNAAPDKIEDAAQEFLTDWLVRRHYDQALAMLSSRSYACVALKAGARGEQLDAAGSRRELLRVMEYATQKLGPRPDLTSAIVAFTPRDPNRQVLTAFRRVPGRRGARDGSPACMCDVGRPLPGAHYGVIFTFRIDGGGTLGLLWTREAGRGRSCPTNCSTVGRW